MEITIVGAGASGGVAGASLAQAGHAATLVDFRAGALPGRAGGLAQAGHAATLVDREAAHVEAIQRDGLRISGYRGELRGARPAAAGLRLD